MNRCWITLMLLLPAFILSGCPNDIGVVPGDGPPEEVEDPYWCCAPDDFDGCVCQGYWHCTEGFDNSKHCVQQNPSMPDDGGTGPWECAYRGDLIVCVGEEGDHPDAGSSGGWDCTTENGQVECSREQNQDDIPDDGADRPYDCTFEDGGTARVCDAPGDGSPDDGWTCETMVDGTQICRNDNPDQPDGGDWDCFRVDEDGDGDTEDYCVGDEMPEGGGNGEWNCQENGEMVECSNGDGQTPDGGDGVPWDCAWGQGNNEFIECEYGEGGEDQTGDCTCIANVTRYCDEPTFCNWGTQRCEVVNGENRWSRCNETAILNGCEPGGADARDYEWHYAGGFWDGQIHDPNDDGILIMPPDNWYNPAAEDCAIRKGFCVQDMWDLDNDLDNQESLGDCEDIEICE